MNLNAILKIQAVAFALYGVGFFLVPDLINDAVFGWEGTEPIFGRIIGGAFIGLALIEWTLVSHGDVSATVAWTYGLIPGLFLIAFIWDKAAGTYGGTDAWYWTNLGVSVVFLLLVGGAVVTNRE